MASMAIAIAAVKISQLATSQPPKSNCELGGFGVTGGDGDGAVLFCPSGCGGEELGTGVAAGGVSLKVNAAEEEAPVTVTAPFE